jgi:glycosyltransferase involved in cell wall biosynthesis
MDVYSLPARTPAHRWVVKAVLRTADVVLSTSHVMREQVLRLVNRPVHVTPFGIDVNRFAPGNRSEADINRVVTIGTIKSLESKYGVDFLIKAFAHVLSRETPEYPRLLIVGEGSRGPDLKELTCRLGIADHVTFAGRQPYRDIHSWHQKLDVAVYPSIDESESFGVSVIESQSCAVPVVVSDIGGLPEVIIPGKTGLKVAPRDSGALAEAIVALVSDVTKRRRMGTLARTHVVTNYSLETAAETMTAIYERVTAGAV